VVIRTNSRSSGHNLALTEIQTLSCDKKVGRVESFYILFTGSLLRRIDSKNSLLTRFASGDCNGSRVLKLATDIVTSESNEGHFAADTVIDLAAKKTLDILY
jgi:hypothetical protein